MGQNARHLRPPMDATFHTAVRPAAGDRALVLSVSGRIDHSNADAFSAALEPVLSRCRAGDAAVVLDLSGLGYVSSAGLRCFMLAARQAKAQSGRLVVAAPTPMVREIFEITRFTLLFDCLATVDEALAAAAVPVGA